MVTTPGIPSPASLDGMHAYVEKHYGSMTAKIVGGLAVLGVCSGCLLAIAALVTPVYSWFRVALANQTIPRVTNESMASLGISLIVLSLLGWWLSRRINALNHTLTRVTGYIDQSVHARLVNAAERLDAVEGSSLKTVDENFKWLHDRIVHLENRSASVASVQEVADDLIARLKVVEPEPLDIPSPWDEQPTSNRYATLMAALSGPRVKPTGAAEENAAKPETPRFT